VNPESHKRHPGVEVADVEPHSLNERLTFVPRNQKC
jgi:hypothetical protein